MVLGPVLALVSSLGWGTSDYLGGRLSARLGALRVLLVSQAAATTVLLLVVVAVGGALPRGIVGTGLLAGVAEAIAIASLYRGLAVGQAGLVAPASAVSPVVPLAVGLVAGSVPGPWRVVGLLLVVGGLVLASREPGTGGARRGLDATSLGYGLVAGVGFGAYFVLMAEASAASVPWALLLARLAAITLIGLGVVVASRVASEPAVPLVRRDVARLLALGLVVVVGDGAYALSSTYGALVLVAVLAATHPVVTILWARFAGGERVDGLRWAGIGVTVAGVVAVTV
ncbi:EamA family transporter [Nocardioides sp. CFH 31398]|uniref:EamA family transporter n=1 Tax=Nocardioides sp. CFH 31398 TaxID=2919579 RepID=UPI001F053921|nr:EamA family transporter [Nocardioides sp. CFH 31398]MCH1866891.1 EamA family transporter [Nocardioides sp. CFH 31398]